MSFHVSNHICMIRILLFEFSLIVAIQSINTCFGLHFQLQVQWMEPQEEFKLCCWSRFHCPVVPRQATICTSLVILACLVFNHRPTHCGSVGYYVSHNHSVYPPFYLCFQSPYFSKRSSSHQKSPVGYVDYIAQVFCPCWSPL